MRRATVLLFLVGASVSLAARPGFESEIRRTISKYGHPRAVPQRSIEYLARTGGVLESTVWDHLMRAWEVPGYYEDWNRSWISPAYRARAPMTARDRMYRSEADAAMYRDWDRYGNRWNGDRNYIGDLMQYRKRSWDRLWRWEPSYYPQRPSMPTWPQRVVDKIESDRARAWPKRASRHLRANWLSNRRDRWRSNYYYGYGWSGYGPDTSADERRAIEKWELDAARGYSQAAYKRSYDRQRRRWERDMAKHARSWRHAKWGDYRDRYWNGWPDPYYGYATSRPGSPAYSPPYFYGPAYYRPASKLDPTFKRWMSAKLGGR